MKLIFKTFSALFFFLGLTFAALQLCAAGRSGKDRNVQAGRQTAVGHHQAEAAEEQVYKAVASGQVWRRWRL